MRSVNQPGRNEGMTLPQAALIVGFAYLLNPVTYAEYVYPKLVIVGNIEQTARNISAHGGLFLSAVFCYLISFIGDVVLALGALCAACAGKQILVTAYRMVPVGICSGRSVRHAKPGGCLPASEHTGVPDGLRDQSNACPGAASAQFISI
jgi:hypothetical protein